MGFRKRFILSFAPLADDDLSQAIDYYNDKQKGLGLRFYKQVKDSVKGLKSNPFFQIYYQQIRCLPVKDFPYLIHFTVDEVNRSVIIIGIINTHLNPDSSYRHE